MRMAPLAILGMLLFVAAGGALVMRLWNWLVPPVFGWSDITFWQALGLLALCRILFGGFRLSGPGRSNCCGGSKARSDSMTAEERERFRQGIRERWDSDPAAGESKG